MARLGRLFPRRTVSLGVKPPVPHRTEPWSWLRKRDGQMEAMGRGEALRPVALGGEVTFRKFTFVYRYFVQDKISG